MLLFVEFRILELLHVVFPYFPMVPGLQTNPISSGPRSPADKIVNTEALSLYLSLSLSEAFYFLFLLHHRFKGIAISTNFHLLRSFTKVSCPRLSLDRYPSPQEVSDDS